jgi:PqqD family protein of HPr-rel-A system
MSANLPTRAEGVVARRAEGLLYDTGSGKLHALNPSAMAIWEACDGMTSVAEIAAAVAELSGRGHDESLGEVEETVVSLRERGLLNP